MQPEIIISSAMWRALIEALRQRGAGVHESGAFLLGTREAAPWARMTEFVLYDDLDPHSLDSGIVRFDGRYYGALWDICRNRGVEVIADVHTHPWGPQQSLSDQAHPMVTRQGHVALIVPRFAMGEVNISSVGVYRYLGDRRWEAIPAQDRAAFVSIQP